MQVYGIVEKEEQMNRTAQRIREIVLRRRLSVYIYMYGFVVTKMTNLVSHMLKNTLIPFVYKFILIM